MFARIVTFAGATDIDAGLAYIRDEAAPVLRQQNGFRAVTASVDRTGGLLAVMSLWETAADRDASDSAMEKSRDEAQQIVGGRMNVELYEETVVEVVGQPVVGNALLVRRLSMDPGRIADNIEYFTSQVVPDIKAEPGFIGIRQQVNRETGDAIVGTVWQDTASMQAAAENASRRQAAAAGRVTFLEQSQREIAFIEVA
jgi:heme-degrading monooxygenase HmoA